MHAAAARQQPCLSLAVRNGVNREGRTMLKERHEKPRLQVPRPGDAGFKPGGRRGVEKKEKKEREGPGRDGGREGGREVGR
jgi:hypothetical protein